LADVPATSDVAELSGEPLTRNGGTGAVMLAPLTAVVAEEVRVVVVEMPATAGPTVTDTVEETLPRSVLDPPKPAVMLCEPVARAVVEKVALPVASTIAEPMVRSPSAKRTLPVGVPAPPAAASA